MSKTAVFSALALLATLSAGPFGAAPYAAAERKKHIVVLGAIKSVPYSKAGDPASAATGEDALKIRALFVDGVLKEWTTGDAHDVTDRSFVVRRVIRLNDALPTDKPARRQKRATGCGSAGHGCWSTALPAGRRRSACPTTTPA